MRQLWAGKGHLVQELYFERVGLSASDGNLRAGLRRDLYAGNLGERRTSGGRGRRIRVAESREHELHERGIPERADETKPGGAECGCTSERGEAWQVLRATQDGQQLQGIVVLGRGVLGELPAYREYARLPGPGAGVQRGAAYGGGVPESGGIGLRVEPEAKTRGDTPTAEPHRGVVVPEEPLDIGGAFLERGVKRQRLGGQHGS